MAKPLLDLTLITSEHFDAQRNITEGPRKLALLLQELSNPVLPVFAQADRPDPASVPIGTVIFNTDEGANGAPNYSNRRTAYLRRQRPWNVS